MAALGDRQEPPRIPPPVSLEPPGTPGTPHRKAPLPFHSHQHGTHRSAHPVGDRGSFVWAPAPQVLWGPRQCWLRGASVVSSGSWGGASGAENSTLRGWVLDGSESPHLPAQPGKRSSVGGPRPSPAPSPQTARSGCAGAEGAGQARAPGAPGAPGPAPAQRARPRPCPRRPGLATDTNKPRSVGQRLCWVRAPGGWGAQGSR